jgi:DNA-directed RNA polymerase subunit M
MEETCYPVASVLKTKDKESIQGPKPAKGQPASKSGEGKSNREEFGSHDEAQERKHKAKRGLKFCPRCGSTHIFFASGLPQMWSLWDCRNCGYRGALVIEDGKLASKLAEEYQKKHP